MRLIHDQFVIPFCRVQESRNPRQKDVDNQRGTRLHNITGEAEFNDGMVDQNWRDCLTVGTVISGEMMIVNIESGWSDTCPFELVGAMAIKRGKEEKRENHG